jgi:hypothetical protein
MIKNTSQNKQSNNKITLLDTNLLPLEPSYSNTRKFKHYKSLNQAERKVFYADKSRKSIIIKIATLLIPKRRKNTLAIFKYIVKHFGGFEYGCYPSHQTIAKKVGCSLDTSQRSIQELNDLGFITKVKRNIKQSNLYFINWEIIDKHGHLLPVDSKKNSPDPTTINKRFAALIIVSKETSIYYKNSINNLDEKKKKRRRKYPEGPFKLETHFYLSKKSLEILNKKVGNSFLKQTYWTELFLNCKKHILAPGGVPWNHSNSNYAFIKFLISEVERKKKEGSRYIPADKRCAYLRNKKYQPTPQKKMYEESTSVEVQKANLLNNIENIFELKVREIAMKKIGQALYHGWIHQLKIIQISLDNWVIEAKSGFVKEFIELNYKTLLNEAIKESVDKENVKVTYKIQG